jgi:hypothetical protein
MTFPWNALALIGVSALLWALSCALEWHLERERRRP